MTREEKMNKRREAGKTYKYEPIPYPKGSVEYEKEKYIRSLKTTTSSKLPYAQRVSRLRKLENKIEAEKKAAKKDSKKENK